MNILIIGSGGREHAFAWKVQQNPDVENVYVAPGNAGTELEPKTQNVAIDPLAIDELLAFARQQAIDLTIVGPEAPLAMGIVNAFQAAGLACFGPCQAAAQLEASKQFCKDFLKTHHIPTASYAVFSDADSAKAYVSQQNLPIVIKADGLAAGKGVIIADTLAEADAAIDKLLALSDSAKLVIEAFLSGVEASFIALCDGDYALPLASSQDHKARDDGDRGPNTGGMGAYSPAPIVDPALEKRVMQEVIYPTLKGMRERGHPFVGFLYAGLMISSEGEPSVLEFNVRCGDPETQVILHRLQSDLVALCQATLNGQLAQQSIRWDPRPALGVVMAAGGYPERYRRGDRITGLDHVNQPDVKVFHAGTQRIDDHICTNGGRVLCVSALGDTIQTAQQQAYQACHVIDWADCYFRSDIGYRAISN